jgi:hypothetical protein
MPVRCLTSSSDQEADSVVPGLLGPLVVSDKRVSGLEASRTLTRLRFDTFLPLTPSDWQALTQLTPRLHHLELHTTAESEEPDSKSKGSSAVLSSLRERMEADQSDRCVAVFVAALSRATRLQWLTLDGVDLSGDLTFAAWLKLFAATSQRKPLSLNTLGLCSNSWSEQQFVDWAKALSPAAVPRLTSLSLCDSSPLPAFVQSMFERKGPAFPLQTLSLSLLALTDAAVPGLTLALARHTSTLLSLDLSDNQLTALSAGFVTALASPACRLQCLDVSSNQLSHTSLTQLLLCLRTNRSLTELKLSNNGKLPGTWSTLLTTVFGGASGSGGIKSSKSSPLNRSLVTLQVDLDPRLHLQAYAALLQVNRTLTSVGDHEASHPSARSPLTALSGSELEPLMQALRQNRTLTECFKLKVNELSRNRVSLLRFLLPICVLSLNFSHFATQKLASRLHWNWARLCVVLCFARANRASALRLSVVGALDELVMYPWLGLTQDQQRHRPDKTATNLQTFVKTKFFARVVLQ